MIRRVLLCLLLLGLWWMFSTAFFPAYLVEGTRNVLGFSFESKETYVWTVVAVRCFYWAVWFVLFALLGRTVWMGFKSG